MTYAYSQRMKDLSHKESCSGKKTVCKMIMERLLEKDQSVARKVVIIRLVG